MGGHLASAAGRIVSRPHRLQKHIRRGNSQCQAQSAIAIVREKPVVARSKGKRGSNLKRFMTCRRYLKEDLLLPLKEYFAVVQPAGQVHQPVNLNQLLRTQATGSVPCPWRLSAGNRKSHSFSLQVRFFPSTLLSV